MPLNEYDDMLASGKTPAAGNEYFGLVQDELTSQSAALKTSMYSAAKVEPDRQAQVISLSEKSGLPVPVVERNFDDVNRKYSHDIDYDDLIKNSPGVSEYLKEPNMASVSHDEIPALRGVEEQVKEFGVLNSMYRSLNVGLAKFDATVAKLPALAYNVAALPTNLMFKAVGRPDLQAQAPDWLMNNPASRFYDRSADAWHTPDLDASITGEIKGGNYGKAGRALAAQFVANAPNQAALLLATVAGYGVPALVGAGAMQAANVSAEAQAKGADPAMATLDALYQGTAEAGFERVGTFGVLKTWEKAIAKQYGKEISKQVFKDFGKTLAYSVAAEGNEEFLTQYAQDFSDYITGVNPDAMKGTFERALNAGIIGGVSGGLMTAPTGVASGLQRGAKMRESALAKDFYTALGSSLEATKTRQRLPTATKNLVDNITKNSPVENIYVSPDAVDKYFEQAKLNPVQIMQDLGAVDSYTEAKQTGGDVKIPLGSWAEKIVGTEHYQGLANDIKFSPDTLSVNESVKLSAELKVQDEQAQAAAKETTTPTAEQAARKVSTIVEEQLKAAGRQPAEAKVAAELYEARIKTRAALRGEDPMTLFEREGLQIQQPVPGQELSGEAMEQASFNALLEKQRQTEGMSAAIKDPKTGELYTGPAHAEILEEAFKTDADLAARLSEELLNRTENVGFANEDFEFITRQQAERQLGILNSESLRGQRFNQAAYHGTPYTVDQFSLTKIGTGEGAAAYGWGLYFAGNKEVAEFYRRTIGKPAYLGSEAYQEARWAKFEAESKGLTGNEARLAAIDTLTKKASAEPEATRQKYYDAANNYDALVGENTTGRLYKVDIPEDDAYIQYEKTGSEQSKDVRKKLEQLNKKLNLKLDIHEHTGENFYEALVQEFENGTLDVKGMDPAEAASRYLADQGIAGIKYLDQGSRTKGEGSSNYVVFDDKLVNILEFEQRQGDEEARGRILFGKNTATIELLKTADQSTFLHETGHLWLNEVGQDLEFVKAIPDDKQTIQQKQFIKDSEATLEWLGATSFENLTREQHEQWARGFESYLMEGKAPTSALRRAFANFKVWLVNVYRQMKSLNVQLTDEVRGVMDRLLATNDEITSARAQQNMKPLFADPTAIGMPTAKADAYLNAAFWAKQNAEQEMNEKLLKEFNRAQESWYKERRSEVEREMTAQVNEMRVYKNIDTLREGKETNGTPFNILRESLEPEEAKRMPRGTVAARGAPGLHVDIVAEMLSYETSDQLLTALSNAPKKQDLIGRMTDERMQQLYPDTMLNGTLPDEAMKAVHNEKRATMIRMELEHLMSDDMPVYKEAVRRIVRRVPSEESIRERAAEIIGGRKVREVRPYTYQLAEVKASREAGDALAKGDINAAFEAKQRELLNHELYRAAVSAQETMDDALELFKKLSKSDEVLAKSRDVDLVNAARAIIANYGLGRTDKTAMDYIAPIQRYDPDTYNAVSSLVLAATHAQGTDYRSVTFDEFVEIKDSVEALWNLSRITEQIEIDGKKLDRETVKLELGARLEEMTKPENRVGYNHAATTWEKTKMYLLGAKSSLRRIETWADAMDAGDPNGVFRKYIWNPVSEAATEYRIAKKGVLEKYLDLIKPIEKSLTTDAINAPELDYKFSNKAELLGTLLHTGNDSNLSKLLRGRGWGTVDELGILDTARWDAFKERMIQAGILTKADYDFVQSVWDLLETLKPQAQRAHKSMYGYYFNEITANEVNTPFGIYRGGYVPAVVDPFASSDAAIRSEREELEKNNNSFMFPTTGRGFTKSRVDAYAAPLALDLRYVPAHIDKVLRFVHIEPHIKDVSRIIMDKSFRHDLDAFDPTVGGDMLVPWLQRTGQQKIQTASQGWGGRAADTFFRELRTRTGMQVMVASVSNALQQFTGLSIGAIKVQPKFLRDSLWSYVRAPKVATAMVNEKSAFMSTRTTTQIMEITQTIDELLINPTKYEKARDFAKKHGYFMQQATQNVVDVIVWSGAYDQAVERGATESDAVRQADSAVRETQGSFNPEDISRFETGSAFQRAFTQFYSYFNMQANLFGTEFSNVARNLGLKKGAGRLLYVYAMGFMIPSVLSELIFKLMGGKLDEDDDDQYMDDILHIFFSGQFKTATALLPFGVGQVINSGINSFNQSWYDDRITVSPAISMIEAAVKAPSEVYRAIRDEGKAAPAIRDSLTLLGLATGLPLAPLSKPIRYLSDVSSGEATPTGPIDFVRGFVSGKSGK